MEHRADAVVTDRSLTGARFRGRDVVLVAFAFALLLCTPVALAQDNPHAREGGRGTPHADEGVKEAAGAAAPSSDTSVRTRGEVSGYADTDAVSVFTPAVSATMASPLSGWSATGSYLIDIVSAASVDIVSTASPHWTEVRHAGAVSGTYKPDVFGVGLSGSVSREPDYLSLSGGGTVSLELFDKTTTPTLGYTHTADTAGRKDTPFSVFSQKLERHAGMLTLELILDPLTLIGFGVDVVVEKGDQSKAYRFLPLFAPDVARTLLPGESVSKVNRVRLPGRVGEHTPEERRRFAVSGRVAQRLSGSTFIFSERLYTDDWGLKASTSDLKFLMDASRRLFIWTHLRGHFQSGVSFYRMAYSATAAPGGPLVLPKWRTGDREMSPLTTGTFGAGMRWDVGSDVRPSAWSFLLQADVMTTLFHEALFVQNRQGYLGVLELEAEF